MQSVKESRSGSQNLDENSSLSILTNGDYAESSVSFEGASTLFDDGLEFSVSFSNFIDHTLELGRDELAFRKVREAFNGRLTKTKNPNQTAQAAALACLRISGEVFRCSGLCSKSRLLPYIIENATSRPNAAKMDMFKRVCAIYTIFNAIRNSKTADSLLKHRVLPLLTSWAFTSFDADHDHATAEMSWLYPLLSGGHVDSSKCGTVPLRVPRERVKNKSIPSLAAMSIESLILLCNTTVMWDSQVERFRFCRDGGLECLLRVVAENKCNINLRDSVLKAIKQYSLNDLIRFRSHCTFTVPPSDKLLHFYNLLKQEKKQELSVIEEKKKLYEQATRDKNDHSLNIAKRLRATALHAQVEVHKSVSVIPLPVPRSNTLLPCLEHKSDPPFILPSEMVTRMSSKSEIKKQMKARVLRTARADAADAIANSNVAELREILENPELPYRERLKNSKNLELATIESESLHRKALVEEANQTTMDVLEKLITLTLDQTHSITNQTSDIEKVRHDINTHEIRKLHATKALAAANVLSKCVDDEVHSLYFAAASRKHELVATVTDTKNTLQSDYNLWKQEASEARALIAENKELLESFTSSLDSPDDLPRAMAKKIQMIRDGVLNDAMVHLKETEKKLNFIKPFVDEACAEYDAAIKRTEISFMSEEETRMYTAVQKNRTYATMMELATQASVQAESCMLEAHQYISKLFVRADHMDSEVQYLTRKIIGLARDSIKGAFKAANAYGAIRHFKAKTLLYDAEERFKNDKDIDADLVFLQAYEAKAVQSEADMKMFGLKGLVRALNSYENTWENMPDSYIFNPTFLDLKEDDLKDLRKERQLTESALELAVATGKYAAACCRLKQSKAIAEKTEQDKRTEGHVNFKADQSVIKKASLDVLLTKWEMEYHRRDLACINYDQLLAFTKEKNMDFKHIDASDRETKRMKFKLRTLARSKQKCNEQFATVAAEKIMYENDKPFMSWAVLRNRSGKALLPPNNDSKSIERLQTLFDAAKESNHVALDCRHAMIDLDMEEADLHKKLRASKNANDLFTKEQIIAVEGKLKIFQNKLDMENWQYVQYHKLLSAQSRIFYARDLLQKIAEGKLYTSRATERERKKHEAEKEIELCDLTVIKVNKSIKEYRMGANATEEQKMRTELERLRIARILERERIAKEKQEEERKKQEKAERIRFLELQKIDAKRKHEAELEEKKRAKKARHDEEIRKQENIARKRHEHAMEKKQRELERKRNEKVRRDHKIQLRHEESERVLARVECAKQAKEVTAKIMGALIARVNNVIDKIEAKRREERKQEVLHRKKMIRECKLWSEEYDDNGTLYYLNYRTQERIWQEPECWGFVAEWEAKKATEAAAEQGGHYDDQGNWIDTSNGYQEEWPVDEGGGEEGGYYDENGAWVDTAGADAGYYDEYGTWVEGAADYNVAGHDY
jgi:hypothetical protein